MLMEMMTDMIMIIKYGKMQDKYYLDIGISVALMENCEKERKTSLWR